MHKSVSSKSGNSRGLVLNLAEIRQDIDAISEKIFCTLAERKRYGYTPSMYAGDGWYVQATGTNARELFTFYKDILKILCNRQHHAGSPTPEIRAIDTKAISLIQERISLGIAALASKEKLGISLRDSAREEELIRHAAKIAPKCGLDSRAGEQIMRMIIRETIKAEQASSIGGNLKIMP